MIAPQRRIWIVQPHAYTDPQFVEVLVLGEPENVAPMVTALSFALNGASSLDAVQPLVMGLQQVGFSARRNYQAVYDNVVAEVHRVLQEQLPIRIGYDVDEDHVMGGTW